MRAAFPLVLAALLTPYAAIAHPGVHAHGASQLLHHPLADFGAPALAVAIAFFAPKALRLAYGRRRRESRTTHAG
ncbi:MAG: hypothetical protein DWQ08_07575 [Proteobacteria bacterium]|nr:MAG: hypothetical protein DWQ08_07575 [Pseudomonadota bacterium]